MRRLLVAVAALVLAAGPAWTAESEPGVRAVMESQGLMGVWSVDCSKPPSVDNGRETIAVEGANVVSTVVEDFTFVADVLTARAVDLRDTEMRIREREQGLELVVVYRRDGERQMTWSSKTADGTDLIVDGRLRSGAMGAWYDRCSEETPVQ